MCVTVRNKHCHTRHFNFECGCYKSRKGKCFSSLDFSSYIVGYDINIWGGEFTTNLEQKMSLEHLMILWPVPINVTVNLYILNSKWIC